MSRIYDQINLALWAALAGCALFVATYTLPQIRANQAAYEAVRQARIDAENAFYCNRLGIGPQAPRYAQCMSELLQFRRSIETQIAAEESETLP